MTDVRPAEALQQRAAARLAAVQALYQMEVARTGVAAVIAEFAAHRLGQEVDGQQYVDADIEFFQDIVRGVVRKQVEVDRTVTAHLAQGWKLRRLDSILRATLRAGMYEILERTDIPVKVVINEYVNVAHAFFDDGDEPGVVNGVLDQAARTCRAEEVAELAGTQRH
jgi:transcription antitermination protein NusB